MLLRRILVLSFLLSPVIAKSQNIKILDSIINTSRLSFEIVNDKPVGDGWNFLMKQYAENNYVGWGEYHNSPLISLLTKEALGEAAKNNYNAWAVEISPMAAAALETYAIDKSAYQKYRKANEVFQGKNFKAFTLTPFFYTAPDSLMLLAAVKNNIKLWGLDHEFQLSFHLYINQAYNNLTKANQVKCKAAYDSAIKYWYMPQPEDIDAIIGLSKSKKDIADLNEVKKAIDIYTKHERRKTIYQSLSCRTDLMKQHYYTYLKAFQAKYKKSPKVFLKMGDNHLAKGINMEKQQYDIGNMIYELSKMEGVNFTNIEFVPRMSKDNNDKIVDELSDPNTPYSPYFLKQYNANKWIVIDLRPMRAFITRTDGSIDENGYEIIKKYDIMVLSPEIN
ncbi:hypothetical protein [Ferruginibacter sp. SUN106]|uniref:hypothetical protein n=1 Tax=Ferruginibacter sp. SUN106 TaxID=2978348 RepID=UPI003D36B007